VISANSVTIAKNHTENRNDERDRGREKGGLHRERMHSKIASNQTDLLGRRNFRIDLNYMKREIK